MPNTAILFALWVASFLLDKLWLHPVFKEERFGEFPASCCAQALQRMAFAYKLAGGFVCHLAGQARRQWPYRALVLCDLPRVFSMDFIYALLGQRWIMKYAIYAFFVTSAIESVRSMFRLATNPWDARTLATSIFRRICAAP